MPSAEVVENRELFRSNSNFISIALWQKVFELQSDWEQNIKDAANILVQLCAPRDAIRHYTQTENEKYELKLSEIQNKLGLSKALRIGSSFQNEESKISEHSTDTTNFQEYCSNTEQSNPEIKSPYSS